MSLNYSDHVFFKAVCVGVHLTYWIMCDILIKPEIVCLSTYEVLACDVCA